MRKNNVVDGTEKRSWVKTRGALVTYVGTSYIEMARVVKKPSFEHQASSIETGKDQAGGEMAERMPKQGEIRG